MINLISPLFGSNYGNKELFPLVISTWDTLGPVNDSYSVLTLDGRTALDGIETGISFCEINQCRGSVDYGGKPDENGETTLDAMIMDGVTHDVGAVGCLRRIKPAISVARKVLENTKHSLLVGSLATQFAIEMGFKEESLTTNKSTTDYLSWKNGNCQPNFWKEGVRPDPSTNCGPYRNPTEQDNEIMLVMRKKRAPRERNERDHDTIGMVVIDKMMNIAVGTSTNGLDHKIPGRVGDPPIPGSGSYVDNDVGGAAATGDGDIMMRFVPSYQAVESMKTLGMSPEAAAIDSMRRIKIKYRDAQAAIIVAAKNGSYGASCTGYKTFPFVVRNPSLTGSKVSTVSCISD